MITLKHRGVEDCWFIYRGTDCIGSVAGGSIHLYRENHSSEGLRRIADAVDRRQIGPAHICGARGFGYDASDRCPACEEHNAKSQGN